MKQYLLDTCICIFFLRGKLNLDSLIKEKGVENCFISEITVFELKYGAENSENPQKSHKAVDAFIKGLTVIPILGSVEHPFYFPWLITGLLLNWLIVFLSNFQTMYLYQVFLFQRINKFEIIKRGKWSLLINLKHEELPINMFSLFWSAQWVGSPKYNAQQAADHSLHQ